MEILGWVPQVSRNACRPRVHILTFRNTLPSRSTSPIPSADLDVTRTSQCEHLAHLVHPLPSSRPPLGPVPARMLYLREEPLVFCDSVTTLVNVLVR